MKLEEAIECMVNAKGRDIILGGKLPAHILAVARVYEMYYRLPGTNLHPIAISVRFEHEVSLDILREICRKENLHMENISYNGGGRYLIHDNTGWRMLVHQNSIKFWLKEAYSNGNREKTLKVLYAYLSQAYPDTVS